MPPMAMLLYLDFNPRMPRTILVTPLGQKRRLQPGSHAAQNPKRLKASDAAAIPLLSLVEAGPGAGGRGWNCSDMTISSWNGFDGYITGSEGVAAADARARRLRIRYPNAARLPRMPQMYQSQFGFKLSMISPARTGPTAKEIPHDKP